MKPMECRYASETLVLPADKLIIFIIISNLYTGPDALSRPGLQPRYPLLYLDTISIEDIALTPQLRQLRQRYNTILPGGV